MSCPGPGSGADAREILRLHKSEHPEQTIVWGADGTILREDFLIVGLADPDIIRASASSIYDALGKAEALYAHTGVPLRVLHTVEREVARVGSLPS